MTSSPSSENTSLASNKPMYKSCYKHTCPNKISQQDSNVYKHTKILIECVKDYKKIMSSTLPSTSTLSSKSMAHTSYNKKYNKCNKSTSIANSKISSGRISIESSSLTAQMDFYNKNSKKPTIINTASFIGSKTTYKSHYSKTLTAFLFNYSSMSGHSMSTKPSPLWPR